jgi:hypothetical protein
LPKYLDLSLSLNSKASCSPVEAPEGTAALPKIPLSNNTSTSIVGLPLESKISLAKTQQIFGISFLLFKGLSHKTMSLIYVVKIIFQGKN